MMMPGEMGQVQTPARKSSVVTVGAAQAGTPRGDTNNIPFEGVYGESDPGASRAQVLAELRVARTAGLTRNFEPNSMPFMGPYGIGMESMLAETDNPKSKEIDG